MYKSSTVCFIVMLFVTQLFVFSAASGQEPLTRKIDHCQDAATVSPTDEIVGYLSESGTSRTFLIDISAPGFLALEVMTSANATEARLGLLTGRCGRQEISNDDLVVERRMVTSLIFRAVNPGRYAFRVSAQDPHAVLGTYRLVTRFVALDEGLENGEEDESIVDGMTLICEPSDLKNGEEDEPIVDGMTLICETENTKNGEEDEPIVDGMTFTCETANLKNGEEDEPIVDGAVSYSLLLAELCRDAIGTSFNCAVPISSAAHAELDGEAHFFTFTLSEQRTVVIETSGNTETIGTLFDGHGLRLGLDDDGGENANFRLVKTLAPGRYFVRVEGGPGPYELRLEALRW